MISKFRIKCSETVYLSEKNMIFKKIEFKFFLFRMRAVFVLLAVTTTVVLGQFRGPTTTTTTPKPQTGRLLALPEKDLCLKSKFIFSRFINIKRLQKLTIRNGD